MTLIKSISGIRGTIGGKPDENLTPIDVVKFCSAFIQTLQNRNPSPTIVVGRDARISGPILSQLVCATLQSMGAHVIDVGLSTTPTVEMSVIQKQADGGIILTASHNPMEWNALKLLNHKGEFISAEDASQLLEIADNEEFEYAKIDQLGTYQLYENAINDHIDAILALPLVDVEAIRNAQFKVAVDAVNSTGGISIPPLLDRLGVEYHLLNGEPTGIFAHNPEPLPEHLGDISRLVVEKKLDLGLVTDPDVDRLAMIMENGEMFGEEYTIVAIADYILQHTPGNTVSNLSSSRALRDVTHRYQMQYEAAAVGEVNVVKKMKEINAVFGGEGNGGVIYPELHYGRDALVGIALFLSWLAHSKQSMTELKKRYPAYSISKNKLPLEPGMDVKRILKKVADQFRNTKQVTDIDGVKIDYESGWVHLRSSNTEPIIRIYSEAPTMAEADQLVQKIMQLLKEIQ